jgi:DNA-directed RNA polymerase specialized sigma subunit
MGRIDVIEEKHHESAKEVFLPYYLGETQEEAEETYHLFSNLLNIIASAYSNLTGIDKGDLFADGLTGLARAKRDWDPDRGDCKFRNWAILKIKTAMNDCCRRNKSIVTIPEYIRVANIYINNIKTILGAYGETEENIRYALRHGTVSHIRSINKLDFERLNSELSKLDTLSKNSKVPHKNLIKRAEYVPTDAYLDDGMTQEEMETAEKRRMVAALVVSKLQDRMTPSELHVANGIMAGKSYEEIGRTHIPPRSIAWVTKQLDSMRNKFK